MKSVEKVITEALDSYAVDDQPHPSRAVAVIECLINEGYAITPASAISDTADKSLKSIEKKLAVAEEKLMKIGDIYNTEIKKGSKTTSMTHMGYNLMGAISDLRHYGKADGVVIDTLERVSKQIAEIAKILGPDLIWDREGKADK